jgi:hypothetical protein
MFYIFILFLFSFEIGVFGDCLPKELTPKHYVAYKLAPNEHIIVDGKIDDIAWQQVAFTTDFIDIRGTSFAKPRFLTKAKMRCKTQRARSICLQLHV